MAAEDDENGQYCIGAAGDGKARREMLRGGVAEDLGEDGETGKFLMEKRFW